MTTGRINQVTELALGRAATGQTPRLTPVELGVRGRPSPRRRGYCLVPVTVRRGTSRCLFVTLSPRRRPYRRRGTPSPGGLGLERRRCERFGEAKRPTMEHPPVSPTVREAPVPMVPYYDLCAAVVAVDACVGH